MVAAARLDNISKKQAALEYERRGYSIIPISRISKKSFVSWTEFQSRRATPGEITGWWQRWPNANIGVVTGAISGIIAIDCDNAKALASLMERGIVQTLTHKTSRGWHFIYKHPGFKASTKVGVLTDVDSRGDGGYIVAPPSVHESGHVYRVERDLPIADAPTWWLDLVKPPMPQVHAVKPFVSDGDTDALIKLALDALALSRSVDHEDWMQVGMALQSAGEQYRSFFHDFSMRCPEKYSPRNCDQTWDSFKRKGINIATLFWMADQDSPGWRPRKQHVSFVARVAERFPNVATPIDDSDPYAIPLSDPTRHLARQCGFGVTYELLLNTIQQDASFTINRLLEESERRGWQVSRKTLEREVTKGINVCWFELTTNPDTEDSIQSNYKKDIVTDFVAKGKKRGKPERHFQILSADQQIENMLKIVRQHIYESLHPAHGKRAVHKPYTPEELRAVEYPEEDAAPALNEVLKDLQNADADKCRAACAKAEAEFQEFEAEVRNHRHLMPLPSGWVVYDAMDIVAGIMRSVVMSAEETSFTQEEWAHLLHVAPSTLSKVRQRAGVQNVEQFAEVWVESEKELKQAMNQYKGGPCMMQVHLIAGLPRGWQPFEWQVFDELRRTDKKLLVKLQVASKQVIECSGQPGRRCKDVSGEDAAPRSARENGPEPIRKLVHPVVDPFSPTPIWVESHALSDLKAALPVAGLNGALVNTDTGEIIGRPATAWDAIDTLLGKTSGDIELDVADYDNQP